MPRCLFVDRAGWSPRVRSACVEGKSGEQNEGDASNAEIQGSPLVLLDGEERRGKEGDVDDGDTFWEGKTHWIGPSVAGGPAHRGGQAGGVHGG